MWQVSGRAGESIQLDAAHVWPLQLTPPPLPWWQCVKLSTTWYWPHQISQAFLDTPAHRLTVRRLIVFHDCLARCNTAVLCKQRPLNGIFCILCRQIVRHFHPYSFVGLQWVWHDDDIVRHRFPGWSERDLGGAGHSPGQEPSQWQQHYVLDSVTRPLPAKALHMQATTAFRVTFCRTPHHLGTCRTYTHEHGPKQSNLPNAQVVRRTCFCWHW